MDNYKFTYRRISGHCQHCEKLKNKSLLSKLFSKKNKELCEFEWNSFTAIGHGPENFSRKEVSVINGEKSSAQIDGHNLDKMVIYLPSGALRVIADWQNCELKLDTDWVLFTKRRMEQESGHDVKLAVNTEYKEESNS
jgi:hypothetical protein